MDEFDDDDCSYHTNNDSHDETHTTTKSTIVRSWMRGMVMKAHIALKSYIIITKLVTTTTTKTEQRDVEKLKK